LTENISETNILWKFKEDWVKTVAARVLMRKLLTMDGRMMSIDDGHSSIPKAHPKHSSSELKMIMKKIFIHADVSWESCVQSIRIRSF